MTNFKLNFVDKHYEACIYYDAYHTPYGDMVFFGSEAGLCGLHFVIKPVVWHVALAKRKFPRATFVHKPLLGKTWWTCIQDRNTLLPVILQGTPFQKKVWKALCDIPLGSTLSYGQLAIELGCGVGGARAVGRAVGCNFIALVVPCHRIVGKGGELVGYRWGTEKKALLLAREQVRSGLC